MQYSAGRRKLWELPSDLHCPVIGSCCSLDDLESQCTKAAVKFTTPPSAAVLHHYCVAEAARPGRLSRNIDRLLNRRHAADIRRLREVDDEDGLWRTWQEALLEEDVRGIFWSLITHPACTENVAGRLRGDVHVRSHAALYHESALYRRIELLRRERADTEARLKEQIGRSSDKRHHDLGIIESLRQELAATRRPGEGDDPAVRRGRSNEPKAADRLRRKLASADARIETLARRDAENRQRIRELETALAANRGGNGEEDEGFLRTPLTEEEKSRVRLDGRSLLYVGGKPRTSAVLKKLVDDLEGRFLYHDGGREDSLTTLGSLVARADIVICPVSQVSHGVVNCIKDQGGRCAACVKFIKRASVTSFLAALEEAAGSTAGRGVA